MATTVEFVFVACKPFDAEHPVGSGEYVHYEPGDVVPAEEWGMAAGHMTSGGTIMRYAINREGPGEDAPAVQEAQAAPVEVEVPSADESGDGQDGASGDDAVLPDDPDDAGAGAEDEAGAAAAPSFPRHLGGGLYELSDGSEAKGKKNAEAAEAVLELLAPAEA